MQELFDNLMNLINDKEKAKFFYKDFVSPFGKTYRIFSYQFATYEDWLKPDALYCRGIMFEIEDEKPVQIVARPMEKFFNLGENPLTMNINFEETPIVGVYDKADGSLVTAFVENNDVYFKSKASIYSTQADMARQVILDYDHQDLKERLKELYNNGYSANFEYVGIDNRIVLIYPTRQLILLNVIHRETGEYVDFSELYKDPILRKYLVASYDAPTASYTDEWVDSVRSATDIEGYVFRLSNGQLIKIKTDWYVALHATKASIESNKNLFEAVTYSSADDLKSLFSDDYSIKKINAFETAYYDFLNDSINIIQSLFKKYSGQDRKQYAIGAQGELSQSNKLYLFGLVMKGFDVNIELDDMTSQLTTIFNKYYENFIPEEYK